MDVKSLGQGGQNAFEFNYGTNNSSTDAQTAIQNNNSSNNINLENKTSGADSYEKSNPQQRQITEKDVKTAADKLNKLLEGKETHVEYDFVGKSRTMSVKIVNDETKEVIKEIPPKKIIEMIDKLCEIAGIMVDEKA
jgi:flagellar protein FlaG